ncbi:MAG: hypothetical protein K6343_02295 [Caldisericaceae bacterium]
MMTQNLTRRQLQFLEALVNLYEKGHLPVSYKDVAISMEVSRWTAYDIIQELYKKGYLTLKYHPVGGKGRSEVLYAPTEEAIELVKSGFYFAPVKSVGNWLTDFHKKIGKLSINAAISFVYGFVEKENNPFLIVLYTISLVSILTKIFNVEINNLYNLKVLLQSNIYAQTVLMFFVESVYGIVEDKYKEEKILLDKEEIEKFDAILKKFRENINHVSQPIQSKIVKYLSLIV